ncbi:hypothetical protein MTR_4g104460 [Medicago truncatula]|uniref:Uncharacterized protein n=1 Tax=Medicago truncatula TaxID=3880 RepID=A0A072V0U3_MEDTR|nr:hypothetical protein MTR_4g104460 [Medicago truncatula]
MAVLLLMPVRESEGKNLEELSYDEGFCSCLKGLTEFDIIGNLVLVCKSELGRKRTRLNFVKASVAFAKLKW